MIIQSITSNWISRNIHFNQFLLIYKKNRRGYPYCPDDVAGYTSWAFIDEYKFI